MELRVLGCGDAFGSGGRFNTCFHLAASGTCFLIDCGATALVAMRRFGVDPNGIETAFLKAAMEWSISASRNMCRSQKSPGTR